MKVYKDAPMQIPSLLIFNFYIKDPSRSFWTLLEIEPTRTCSHIPALFKNIPTFYDMLKIAQTRNFHSSVRTNRANVLESSCIRSTTCFPPNRATLSLVILDHFSDTYMLGGIFQLIPTSVSETGIVSDGPTDTRTSGGKIITALR